MHHLTTGLLGLLTIASCAYALDTDTLPEITYHTGGIDYWSAPYYANSMYHGGGWASVSNGTTRSLRYEGNGQFDANGYPKHLNQGEYLRHTCFSAGNYWRRPPYWPFRGGLTTGRYEVSWVGDGDVRFRGGSFVAAGSSGPETGNLVNGTRVYHRTSGGIPYVEIHGLNPANRVTEIRAWLPDPSDPCHRSLTNQLWHSWFLDRLGDMDWGAIRFMNMVNANASPVKNWTDRRVPAFSGMTGVLNRRSPADGYSGDRQTGIAYEHCADLCNRTGHDMWMCIPHLATTDFVYKLAQLLRYGSDGVDPYASAVPDPEYPPLDTNLRVYVETSNEIWSQGDAFCQGNWAQDMASSQGISKVEFNARLFCRNWSIFQEVFGGTDRLIRVAAVFAGNDGYSSNLITEAAAYGPTLTPPVQPDIISPAIYFGNDIQGWVHSLGWVADKHYTSDYWLTELHTQQMQQAFAEWTRRLLSGDAQAGEGPDATGVGGGYSAAFHQIARDSLPYALPIVAYEGGPSLYTQTIDGGPMEDDGITIFLESMNRHPLFEGVYAIHLNMAKEKGLRSHSMFTDCSTWGKYGQWGHLEYPNENPTNSVKYSFLLDWNEEASRLQHVDHPAGAVPQFDTDFALPLAEIGTDYTTIVETSGGNGALTAKVTGTYLAPGLTAHTSTTNAGQVVISGRVEDDVPGSVCYVYVRVVDGDGDPAWRTFTLKLVGGPGVLVESDFRGTAPVQNRPWTNVYVIESAVDFSGWDGGSGLRTSPGDDALVYNYAMPASEGDATLALAIADQEYVGFSLGSTGAAIDLRSAVIQLTIRRMSYHAPRKYALLTSIGGFTDGAQVYETERIGAEEDRVLEITLPDTSAYGSVSTPVEFRLYGYAGQYASHATSVRAFKLSRAIPEPSAAVAAVVLMALARSSSAR